MAVSAIPEGHHSVTPYLIVDGGAEAIEWYKQVFGAEEIMRLGGPEGAIGHAELRIGDSRIMLADENPQFEARAPGHFGGSPVTLHLYVTDVDAVVNKATGAGATLNRPVQDMFYGNRTGSVTDPFGHVWHVATHIEDVSIEEIERRMAQMHKS
ncbi:MAG TPA: VOC family protein [Rhodopila sp.]|nr:VOC family protein [Rhodopila sp.]